MEERSLHTVARYFLWGDSVVTMVRLFMKICEEFLGKRTVARRGTPV